MVKLNLLILTQFNLPCFGSQNLVSIWYSREEEKFEKLVGTLSLSGPGPGDPWRQWQRIVSQFYCLLSRLLSKQLWSAHTSQCTTLSLTLGFKLERETWGFKVQWFGHIILRTSCHFASIQNLASWCCRPAALAARVKLVHWEDFISNTFMCQVL